MRITPRRTLRYVRSWLTDRADLVEEEVPLARNGADVPATLIRPRAGSKPRPGWIVLYGITRTGRRHDQLMRFTRALASTGSVVIVPEVPEWRSLNIAPGLTVPTVEAAVAGLRARADVASRPLGVVGFSFGAPHAIAAAGAPSVRDEIAGAVGFGGYCDLARTIRFMLTGRHEWDGDRHRLQPDPYGRWIVAANYLTAIPEHEGAEDVAEALRALAAHAGDSGRRAWDPSLDSVKSQLRGDVAPHRRSLFDLFAPPSDREPDPERAASVAEQLAEAAVRVDPEIDPARALARVDRPVHVLHGRHDRLIPFTEGLRIRSKLPPTTWSRATVTRLFGHSSQDPFPGRLEGITEAAVFLNALSGVLGLV